MEFDDGLFFEVACFLKGCCVGGDGVAAELADGGGGMAMVIPVRVSCRPVGKCIDGLGAGGDGVAVDSDLKVVGSGGDGAGGCCFKALQVAALGGQADVGFSEGVCESCL